MKTGVITGLSVSHTRAGVDEIEAAGGTDERTLLTDLLAHDAVEEAFALTTCNRAEAYVVTESAAEGRRALSTFAPDVRDGAIERLDHEESLRHLMRVAAGLESLVLGEDQILGQVRTAFEESRAVGGIGPVLEDAVTKAIHVGERARTETKINEGVVSLGSAAVELAATKLDLEGITALVVGAGEMGTLAARTFAAAGVERIVVANRTVPHAEHVASGVDADASAVAIDAAPAAAAEADVVIAATSSPECILDRDALSAAGETVVVDIAQPRDVDPEAGEIGGVDVHDLDALEAVTEQTRERRREAAARVETMIDEEFERLTESFRRKRADEAIATMYESAELVKEREVERALGKLEVQGDLTESQRETVEALADALVGQLLAAPTRSLRDAAAEDDWTTIQTAMSLFDPDFGGDDAVGGPVEAATPSERTPDDRAGEMPDAVREEFLDD